MLCPLHSQAENTGIDQRVELSQLPTALCTDGVYDLAGRRVLSGAASVSALRQLPRGIYVVCRNGGRRIVQR